MPWQRKLHAKGWVAPSWPKEYGGTGWGEMQRYIFASECAQAGTPGLAPMGLRMVGPCIMRYGTPEQKAFFLPRILAGEDYWCQGYSEPGSGSDLASLQLRADSDGEDYVLNGSKIWTTHAHHANRMFCLVRTNFDGKPQQGITFLLLEMKTLGLSVRPIITLAGEHEVNQVFFDNVRVPKSGRLGEENDGWTVAKYLLEFERGGGSAAGLKVSLGRLRAMAGAEAADAGGRLLDDPAYRARLAELEIAVEAIEVTEHRVMSALSAPANQLWPAPHPCSRPSRPKPCRGSTSWRSGHRGAVRPDRSDGRPRARRQHRLDRPRTQPDRHAALSEQPRRLDLWRLQRNPAQHHGPAGVGALGRRTASWRPLTSEAAPGQEGGLLCGRGSAQDGVAVWETAEAGDDVGVVSRMAQIALVAGAGGMGFEQRQ